MRGCVCVFVCVCVHAICLSILPNHIPCDVITRFKIFIFLQIIAEVIDKIRVVASLTKEDFFEEKFNSFFEELAV